MPAELLERSAAAPDRPAANGAFGLPEGFWDRFLADGWDENPRVLRQPFAAPLAEPGEVFAAVKTASEALRAGDRRSPMRFLMEEEFVLIGPMLDRYLPVPEDASLGAYADRIMERTGGRRFGLALNLFHVHDWELWTRMRRFAAGLSARIPPHYVHPAVFLGNYDRTPFGIHRDPIRTFMFVLEGRKRLHVWPRDYFRDENDPRLAEPYDRLLPGATTLEGGPGDVLFWPIDYWHVGESVGGMSMSVNVGLHAWSPFEALQARLDERGIAAPASAGAAPFTAERLRDTAGGLAGELRRRAAALQTAAEDADLRHALEAAWLRHVTGSCFNVFPPPLPWRPLDDSDWVRGSAEFPVRWLPAPDRKMLLSANGHSFTLPYNPRVLELVERLNGGRVESAGRLLAEHAGEGEWDGARYRATPEGLRTVLSKLVTFRALDVQPGPMP